MFKSQLQELCQRRGWELPEYSSTKEGPDHMPRFTGSVEVKGQVFAAPNNYRSAKEAQNSAALIALDYFAPRPLLHATSYPAPMSVDASIYTIPNVVPVPEMQYVAAQPTNPIPPHPASLPIPPPGLLLAKTDANTTPIGGEALKLNCEDTTEASKVYRTSISSHDKSYKETLHMCKNRLQQYAQKQNLGFPVYTSETEGPPHTRRFKCRVFVGGKSYETLEFFSTLKEAEQAAAKVACQFLPVDATQEDEGLFKNLLQEFAQKKGLVCPSYETVSSGLSHKPVFVSTVEIGGQKFKGAEGKTKKQAEMSVAKVAYVALMESHMGPEYSGMSSVKGFPAANNLGNVTQPTPMTENSDYEIVPAPVTIKHKDHILPVQVIEKDKDAILPSSINKMNENAILPDSPVCKKHEDATDEGVQSQAKRSKPSLEKEDSIGHPTDFSINNTNPVSGNLYSSSQEQVSIAAVPVTGQLPDSQPSPQRKTVVFPRKSSLPIPEGACVMPYSDEQWVAYKVEAQQEPTS